MSDDPQADALRAKYWSERVARLEPYVPGEQPRLKDLVKLNTNENPNPPSPMVIAAIQSVVNDDLRLYPPPDAADLKAVIAGYYHLQPNQVFVGNGSDEVLAHIFNALLKHDGPVLFPDVTYSFYPVYCRLYDIDYREIPLTEAFAVDVDDYLTANGGVIFSNPNAPTGCMTPLAEIEHLLQDNRDSVVVIDEAYIDFGGDSAVGLINRYPNLLVVQTLSKSRSLAGLRVGLALGNEVLIEALERIKNSFNSYPLSCMAIAGGIAAFADEAHFQATRKQVISSRENLVEFMRNLGFEVLPSAANFIFVRHPKMQAVELAARLRERSVIVRHFNQPRINQFLRITIGSEPQNQCLKKALEELCKPGS